MIIIIKLNLESITILVFMINFENLDFELAWLCTRSIYWTKGGPRQQPFCPDSARTRIYGEARWPRPAALSCPFSWGSCVLINFRQSGWPYVAACKQTVQRFGCWHGLGHLSKTHVDCSRNHMVLGPVPAVISMHSACCTSQGNRLDRRCSTIQNKAKKTFFT